jgi:two-component sensor histidine kinase
MVLREFTPAKQRVSLELVEEINHRVINEYAEAIASLSLAAHGATEPARSACEGAAQRLHAHAAAHRALLPPAGEELVDAADYLRQICNAYADAALADRKIRLIVKAESIGLLPDRCWRLGLIVAELVRNAARHGLSRRAGLIVVRLNRRSGQADCLVCDSGRTIGRPAPGRGQRLLTALAADLGGSIDWWFTPQGGMAHLQFPDPSTVEARDEMCSPELTPDVLRISQRLKTGSADLGTGAAGAGEWK